MKKGTTTRKRATNSSSNSGTGTRTRKKATNTESQLEEDSENSEEGQEEQKPTLLENLFHNMLQDVYGAEKALVPALSKMQQSATTEELQEAFEDHMYVTQKHVSRLEKVFSLLGLTPEEKQCAAMEGLINEANELMEKTEEGTMTRDAALIIAAQKVEHYEIATYGSLVQLALTLGHEQPAYILEKTLWEEEDTDALLTDIAECEVNPLADSEPMEVDAELEEAETE